MRVLNLAISNKSSLACTNFSVFKREQIYVLAYYIQIYVIVYSIQIYVIAYSIQIYVIAYSIQIYVIAYSIFLAIFSLNAKFAKISTRN